MTTLFDPDLSAREFGGAELHVGTFFNWLKEKGLHIRSIPMLSNSEFVQVEALLCAVGGAAVADLTLEQASKIVANDKALRARFVGQGTGPETKAMLAGKLASFDAGDEEILVGAPHVISGSAHQKWRDLISRAVENGELELLDHASKLPIRATEPQSTPTAEPANVDPSHDITKERGCRRLILENWESIKTLHGSNADGIQTLRVLKRNLEQGEKVPALKTVRNCLTALRNDQLIP